MAAVSFTIATAKRKTLLFTPKPTLSRNHHRRLPKIKSSFSGEPFYVAVKTYAPATIAHFGSDFERLGCAVEGLGDVVTLKTDPDVHPGQLLISGFGSCDYNFAGSSSVGLSMSVEKGVPSGVGLGSTAATIAAATMAFNEMFGGVMPMNDLILEAMHSDVYRVGMASTLLGGFVGYTGLPDNPYPWGLSRLKFPANKSIWFVLVIPSEIKGPTKKEVEQLNLERHSLKGYHRVWVRENHVHSEMVLAIEDGDLQTLGFYMSKMVSMEKYLQKFIPGFNEVKQAALMAGALGFGIAGAGPTVVAFTDDEIKGKLISKQMVEAFKLGGGVPAVALVQTIDPLGARLINRVSK